MVLEATVIIVDNSEWMRNGDFTPTRLEAQKDAVNLIFNSKQQSHPENSVAVLSAGGKSPQVLVTLTSERGKILNALHAISIQGKCNFLSGIQVAQLSLKHRQNKNQHQRIVCFVGSPISEDEAELVKVAKKLKKNGIAVDVVNFGEEVENTSKLDAFVSTLNSSNNSHLVTVPPGPNILSDVLLSSAIISGPDGAPSGVSGGGANFEFGVDPSLDPELALALRLSMEEEQARQGSGPAGENGGGGASSSAPVESSAMAMDTEDDELARAIAMSLQDSAQEAKKQPKEDKKK